MILVLEYDGGSEPTVVGLYSYLQTAVDTIMHDAQEQGVEPEQLSEFRERVREVVEQEHGAPVIDFRIESPFASVDLQFVSVELKA